MKWANDGDCQTLIPNAIKVMKTSIQFIVCLILFTTSYVFAYDLQAVDVHALQLKKWTAGAFLLWTNTGTAFYISPVKVDFTGLVGKTWDEGWRSDLHDQIMWQHVPTVKRNSEGFESGGYRQGSGEWAFVEGTNLVLTTFQIYVSESGHANVTNHVFQVHCESFSIELEKDFADEVARALEEAKSGATTNKTH